jgi:hypothetical protein
VTNQGKLLPNDVVAHWPEVFGDVKLNVVPIGYLHMVLIRFKDGKVWEIRITTRTKKNGWKSFEKSLTELYKTYEDSIEELDFRHRTCQERC